MKFTFLISVACLLALKSCSDDEPNAELPSVVIGTQTWTKSNLDVVTYRNGDTIPQVTDAAQWHTLTTGAWCYSHNDSNLGATYGKLYNWYAVNDPRGLAPDGWHIPTVAEWTTLSEFLGGTAIAGSKLKEAGNTHWVAPNTDATNESGFTALPASERTQSGFFNPVGYETYWWAADQLNDQSASTRVVAHDNTAFYPGYYGKLTGLAVRCVKD